VAQHGDWVTSLATTAEDPNLLLSSSRDKSVIVWHLTHSSASGDDDSYGFAKRALKGVSKYHRVGFGSIVRPLTYSSVGTNAAFALCFGLRHQLRWRFCFEVSDISRCGFWGYNNLRPLTFVLRLRLFSQLQLGWR
jgi:hypothetical protein